MVDSKFDLSEFEVIDPNEELERIVTTTIHLIDEFVIPYKPDLIKMQDMYRENVAPRFREMITTWKISYKGPYANLFQKCAIISVIIYYIKQTS